MFVSVVVFERFSQNSAKTGSDARSRSGILGASLRKVMGKVT
jgi:hypothetical protein